MIDYEEKLEKYNKNIELKSQKISALKIYCEELCEELKAAETVLKTPKISSESRSNIEKLIRNNKDIIFELKNRIEIENEKLTYEKHRRECLIDEFNIENKSK